jgi:hypothetical protein
MTAPVSSPYNVSDVAHEHSRDRLGVANSDAKRGNGPLLSSGYLANFVPAFSQGRSFAE